ncbi:MAG: hypothetical protein R2710_19545 [Acidimicrobiales bacterium]
MARSLLIPGAGLYDEHLVVGVALTLAAVAATIAWLRWGLDSILLAVVGVAIVVSGLMPPTVHAVAFPAIEQSAHEFPLVILVVGALAWLRSALRRVPIVGRLAARRSTRRLDGLDDLMALPPLDRCRAVSVLTLPLAGAAPAEVDPRLPAAVGAADVERRARRIGLLARGRRGGDPFRVDHAAARTARLGVGALTTDQVAQLRADAVRAWAGVPASEPTWVRLFDAVVAAIALDPIDPEPARRVGELLHSHLGLRRGHRPAWIWTPLAVAAGRADDWEHTAATALARAAGWIGDDDWSALRRRAFGAAARGTVFAGDERTVAAARIWTALVDDPEAARILARPTVAHDPLAVALDTLATRLRASAPVANQEVAS